VLIALGIGEVAEAIRWQVRVKNSMRRDPGGTGRSHDASLFKRHIRRTWVVSIEQIGTEYKYVVSTHLMRFFFNLSGATHTRDDEGTELPTIADARLMAAKHAGELLADQPELAWHKEEFRVEVTTSDQVVLFTLIILGVPSGSANGGA